MKWPASRAVGFRIVPLALATPATRATPTSPGGRRPRSPRFPWARWYSELAPDGEYLKAPLEYVRLSRAAATEMIQLIKAGQPLPPQFVSSLPVVW